MKNLRLLAALVLLVIATLSVAVVQTASAIEPAGEPPAVGYYTMHLPLVVNSPAYDPVVCTPDPSDVITYLGEWTWGQPNHSRTLPGVPCPDTIILGIGDMYGVPSPFGAGFARVWDSTQNPRASISLERAGTFRMWRISGTTDFRQWAIRQLAPLSADRRIPVMPFAIYGPSAAPRRTNVSFQIPKDIRTPSQPVEFRVDATGNPSSPLCRAPECGGGPFEVTFIWPNAGTWVVTATLSNSVNSVVMVHRITITDDAATPTATPTATPSPTTPATATPTATIPATPTATPTMVPAVVSYLGLWEYPGGQPGEPALPNQVRPGSAIFGMGDLTVSGHCSERTWWPGSNPSADLTIDGRHGTFRLWLVIGTPEAIQVAVADLHDPNCH